MSGSGLPTVGPADGHEALRRVFLADQSDAAHEEAAKLPGSSDGLRRDLCRHMCEMERFAFHAVTLLVTGRCCARCRPIVYGELG